MLTAAAVCPSPPLLVPELAAGAAAELADLRTACDAALADVLAARPETVVVVGAIRAGEPLLTTMAPYGVPVPVCRSPLPLAPALGEWLLDRVGWTGGREPLVVAVDEAAAVCREHGAALRRDPRRLALLVMADGSARRSERAPGWIDRRAEPFDAAVARALADGDAAALAAVDPELAGELLAAGRAPWQLLAAAAQGATWAATLRYDAAPYGVGYLVASWRTPP